MTSERDRRLGVVARSLFSTHVAGEPSPEPTGTTSVDGPETQSQVWREAIRIAQEEPRISFVSQKVKAVLMYLRKTTPEFNISRVTAALVEEAVRKRYPDLWKRVE